jgi:hypothetical protein
LTEITGHSAVGTFSTKSNAASGMVNLEAKASNKSLWTTTTLGILSPALVLGLTKTSH